MNTSKLSTLVVYLLYLSASSLIEAHSEPETTDVELTPRGMPGADGASEGEGAPGNPGTNDFDWLFNNSLEGGEFGEGGESSINGRWGGTSGNGGEFGGGGGGDDEFGENGENGDEFGGGNGGNGGRFGGGGGGGGRFGGSGGNGGGFGGGQGGSGGGSSRRGRTPRIIKKLIKAKERKADKGGAGGAFGQAGEDGEDALMDGNDLFNENKGIRQVFLSDGEKGENGDKVYGLGSLRKTSVRGQKKCRQRTY